MILDVEKFIRQRRSEWKEFEQMVALLESDKKASMNIGMAQRYNYLYERVTADLSKLSAYAVEPPDKALS